MRKINTNNKNIFSKEKLLYISGSYSAFILVIGYICTFPLYAWVGSAPQTDIVSKLLYFSNYSLGWCIILGLMVFTDLLYIPIYLALYNILKDTSKFFIVAALVFIGLFIVLDLAMTWTSHFILIINGVKYINTAVESQKAEIAVIAAKASTILSSPLLGFYVIVFPSVAVFITGILMYKGRIFNKITSTWAIIAGISGILYLGSYVLRALDVIRIINAILLTVWYCFIAFGLNKYHKDKS
jgi:hypothetical protein